MALTANEINSLKTGMDPATGKKLTPEQLQAIQAKATDSEIQLAFGKSNTADIVKMDITNLPNKLANTNSQLHNFGYEIEKRTITNSSNDIDVQTQTQVCNKTPTDGNPTTLIIDQLNSKKDINGANGIFLGDAHGCVNIQEFLVNQMPELKKAGVNNFYMEMFDADDQAMIDKYYEKGDNEQEIVNYLKVGWEKTDGSAQRYFNIIKTAKENGIKVYGIDEPTETYLGQSQSKRLERANPFWANVIKEHTETSDKYIIYGGSGHSANYSMNKGVDQLLGDIPSIDFGTSSSSKNEIVVGDGKDNDFEILLPKSPNQPDDIFYK